MAVPVSVDGIALPGPATACRSASTRATVLCATGRPASRLTRAAIALALAALAFDRPTGAGPADYPRKMECQRVGDDRLRCYFD